MDRHQGFASGEAITDHILTPTTSPTFMDDDGDAPASARWTTAAPLAVDIVGYCRLIEDDPLGTALRVRRLHVEVLGPAATAHGGRVVDHIGDAALLAFDDVGRALRAAVAIQRRVRLIEARTGTARPMRLRVGIDAGEVLILDGAIYGRAVNVACRLQAIGEAGDILLTGGVRRGAEPATIALLEARGTHRLRHIAGPVEVYRLPQEDHAGSTLTAPVR